MNGLGAKLTIFTEFFVLLAHVDYLKIQKHPRKQNWTVLDILMHLHDLRIQKSHCVRDPFCIWFRTLFQIEKQ